MHLLVGQSSIASDGLQNDILKCMNPGKIATSVCNDPLILRYGNNMHFQHGHQAHHFQYLSQELRQLGRLFVTSRSLDGSIHQLSDCICASKSEAITPTVQNVSGFSDDTHLYKTPSIQQKNCHSLHEYANIWNKMLCSITTQIGSQMLSRSLIYTKWNGKSFKPCIAYCEWKAEVAVWKVATSSEWVSSFLTAHQHIIGYSVICAHEAIAVVKS